MICSVLIPSRARPERLIRTIESIQKAARTEDYEVLLRLDDDDKDTVSRELDRRARVRVVTGPRMRGYPDLNVFYTQLSDVARGLWVWIMNDDATVSGQGWDVLLRKVPTTGVIAQPEFHKLNRSMYPRNEGGAFPLVPNGCWKSFGWTAIQDPADSRLDELLRGQHGWTTHFLAGITVHHQRDADEALWQHRLL